ncbi:lipid IV(A) 3-deoxy-D-manno-octulosonic acid transferase [Thalassotalea fusca]
MRYFFSLTLYRIIVIALLPVLLLALLLRSRKNPAYRQRIRERLGIVPSKIKPNSIVIHAASVGEVIALKPLIDKLLSEHPQVDITFTSFTPTGSQQITSFYGDKVQHCYLPIDCWPCTWMFLQRLKPKALIIMETEIWPNLIAQAHSKHIPLLLINGRLTEKSVKQYKKFSWLVTPTLNCFNRLLVQSIDNLHHFQALDVSKKHCSVSGNIKFDLSLSEQVKDKHQLLAKFIQDERPTWLVASTHPGDEALILESFSQLKQQHPALLLILVPRHPERFAEVSALCEAQQWQVVNRSDKLPVTNDIDIWVIDTLGELLPACALADVVTMGGSFNHIGGHNPLEPALFKKAIIVGPNMSNFAEITQRMLVHNGIIQLNEQTPIAKQLFQQVNDILLDESERSILGQQAHDVVLSNQGATDKTCRAIVSLIK